MKKLFLSITLCALLAACTGAGAGTSSGGVDAKTSQTKECAAGKALGNSDAGLVVVELCIKSGKISRSFSTEIAATSREQATGLMFRKSLADNAGMIFPFPQPRQASFWMKNTLIPLDIIFIRSNGTIESIAENTVPYSEAPVASGEEVTAVLELRGGLTQELGIKAGDTVSWNYVSSK
jgi:uncharacterized protein